MRLVRTSSRLKIWTLVEPTGTTWGAFSIPHGMKALGLRITSNHHKPTLASVKLPLKPDTKQKKEANISNPLIVWSSCIEEPNTPGPPPLSMRYLQNTENTGNSRPGRAVSKWMRFLQCFHPASWWWSLWSPATRCRAATEMSDRARLLRLKDSDLSKKQLQNTTTICNFGWQSWMILTYLKYYTISQKSIKIYKITR